MAVDNFHNFITEQRNWNSFLTLQDAKDGLSQLQAGVRAYIITEDRFYYWKNDVDEFVPESQSTGADDQIASEVPYDNTSSGLTGTNVQTAIDEVVGAASGATNLAVANKTGTTLDVTSDTGANATVPAATITEAGVMSAADKTKLDGVTAGAEPNVVDSVNTQTGAVVLDADDISDTLTTNKFVTSGDLTTLANTSGTNTGDETSATDVSEGIVELATQTEVDTGTDTSRAITPAVLAGSALQTKVNGIASGAEVNKDTLIWRAGRNQANTTGIYLRDAQSVPTNLSPFIAPYTCTIKSLSLTTNGNESWTAEVRVDIGAGFVTQATLVATAESSKTSVVNISLNAGDKVGFFCNGTNINRPVMTTIVEEN